MSYVAPAADANRDKYEEASLKALCDIIKCDRVNLHGLYKGIEPVLSAKAAERGVLAVLPLARSFLQDLYVVILHLRILNLSPDEMAPIRLHLLQLLQPFSDTAGMSTDAVVSDILARAWLRDMVDKL